MWGGRPSERVSGRASGTVVWLGGKEKGEKGERRGGTKLPFPRAIGRVERGQCRKEDLVKRDQKKEKGAASTTRRPWERRLTYLGEKRRF